MRLLLALLIGCCVVFTLAREAAADGHLPACHFKHMVVNQCNPCAPKCYWVNCYSAEGEETGWCEDPYLRLCFEVPRPRCCHPTPVPDCVPHGTCASSPSCSCAGSCQCVAVVKGAGCGCEKAVPTPAPVPTRSVVQPQCVGGQCYAPGTQKYQRWGGGHVGQSINGNDNAQTSLKVVQVGAINWVRKETKEDGGGDFGSGPIRGIIDKIRNRPSPGPGR